MSVITVQPLERKDAPMLSSIARRSYGDHFRYLWEDDGEAYMAKSFSAEFLEDDLSDPVNVYFAAFQDGEAAGFLKLRPNSTLAMFGDADAFEIERIYLAKEFKGRGIGARMMDTAIEMAESMGKDLVWLKVMAENDSSIGFYQRCGFSLCGNEVLSKPRLRAEHSAMYVMRKELKKSGR